MKTIPLASLLLPLLSASVGVCQTAPTASPTATIPKTPERPPTSLPVAFPASPANVPVRSTGAVSPDLSAKIGSANPKFSPPKESEIAKPEELPDMRDIDKPRNGIIRLPKVMVEEPKVPVFNQRELLTPTGKLELALKRHPGLRFGSLPFLSNNAIALFMLEEEQRLERKAEMQDLAGLYRYSDPGAGAAAKAEADKVFIRSEFPSRGR